MYNETGGLVNITLKGKEMECIFKARDQIDCIWREIEKCNIDNPTERINFISTMLYVAFNHCMVFKLWLRKEILLRHLP
jgi:hypothetical protein